jgi:hypothetical protein
VPISAPQTSRRCINLVFHAALIEMNLGDARHGGPFPEILIVMVFGDFAGFAFETIVDSGRVAFLNAGVSGVSSDALNPYFTSNFKTPSNARWLRLVLERNLRF